jgi:cytochrome c oxidase subunit 2
MTGRRGIGRRPRRIAPAVACLLSSLLLAGCGGMQSPLDPAGPQAARIDRLWWLTFWVSVAVYVLVMAAVLWAVARRRGGPVEPQVPPVPATENRTTWIVSSLVAVSVAVLFVLLVTDFMTGRAIHSLDVPDALVVRVTGHQWWWEVVYPGSSPDQRMTTANELHVPIGKPVRVELVSNDVIHSFWVPNLAGKRDLIPGHPTTLMLQADRPGEFRGQCAEFCGLQHANMRLVVFAEPEEKFHAWLDARRKPAAEPTTEGQKRGRDVFLGSACLMCHTVSGTTAQGRVGPDLTHVGDRPRIGAGTLPNTRGHLAGWVADPQSIKPGVKMPPNPLPPDDLRALLDYLESLK